VGCSLHLYSLFHSYSYEKTKHTVFNLLLKLIMIFNCWFESYLFGSMVKNDTRDFSDFYRSVEFEEDRWTHYSVPEILENLWSRADCIQKP